MVLLEWNSQCSPYLKCLGKIAALLLLLLHGRGGVDHRCLHMDVVETWEFVRNEISKKWQWRQRHKIGSKPENLIEVQNPRNTNMRTRQSAHGRDGTQVGDRWVCVHREACMHAWHELEKNGHGLFCVMELSNASHWVDGCVTKLPGGSETRGTE